MSDGLANDGGTPPESPTGTSVDVNALQGRIAELEGQAEHQQKLLRDAREPVEIYVKLAKTNSGKEIIERLKAGEELTARQADQLEKAQGADGSYVTPEQMQTAMQELGGSIVNHLSDQNTANRRVEALHKRAAEELAGYDNISGTDEWNSEFNAVIERLKVTPQDGGIALPQGEKDVWWYAIKRTYGNLTADNPEIGKLKPVPKSPADRKAAIVSQQSTSVTPAPDEEVSEGMRQFHEDYGDVGKPGRAAVGKRF